MSISMTQGDGSINVPTESLILSLLAVHFAVREDFVTEHVVEDVLVKKYGGYRSVLTRRCVDGLRDPGRQW